MSSSGKDVKEGMILGGRWKLKGLLGAGGFGQVFKAVEVGETPVEALIVGEPVPEGAAPVELEKGRMAAVKVEYKGLKKEESLPIERAVFESMKGAKHTPAMFDYGTTDTCLFLVMERLSLNLAEIRRTNTFLRFSKRTTYMIALQALEAIREMHDRGWVHRDIKPSNLAVGLAADHKSTTKVLYLFDFGLCRHVPGSEKESAGHAKPAGRPGQASGAAAKKKAFRGTPRYASINAHRGRDLGRVDDLWSYLYTVVELGRGLLPWRRMRSKQEIFNSKKHMTTVALLGPDGDVDSLPHSLWIVVEALRSCGTEIAAIPDYGTVQACLEGLLKEAGGEGPWDWEEAWTAIKDEKAGASTRQERKRFQPARPTATSLGATYATVHTLTTLDIETETKKPAPATKRLPLKSKEPALPEKTALDDKPAHKHSDVVPPTT